MALKLDPVDLMTYADVAEAFEAWLIEHPEASDDVMGIVQSRVFAKTYLNLYVTFLQMIQYVPKEKISYESDTDAGVKRRFDNIDEIYTDLKKTMSDDEKKTIEAFNQRNKPTLH